VRLIIEIILKILMSTYISEPGNLDFWSLFLDFIFYASLKQLSFWSNHLLSNTLDAFNDSEVCTGQKEGQLPKWLLYSFFYLLNIEGFLVFFFQTLATSQGNILENKDLIESLNQTKASSALIQGSLAESCRLQSFLDKVEEYFNVLLPFFSC